MHLRTATWLVSGLLLAACVIPIPTPEWGDEPIGREQSDLIERGIGALERDEIEAILGPPQLSYAQGRVVVYAWTRKQGIWIVGVPAGFGGFGDIAAGESEHRLCLLLDERGILQKTKHIDSALGMADSRVADVLGDWIGAAAATGYARAIDVEGYSMPANDGPEVGILLSAERERRPSCWRELDAVGIDGYRLYTEEDLRDAFYPWLEPPWYDHLATIAASGSLAEARQASHLRFIVVVSNLANGFPERLCNDPYTVSCYDVRYRDERGRVALLDLTSGVSAGPSERTLVETLKIPFFPVSRDQACESLMVYAADDIAMRVARDAAD